MVLGAVFAPKLASAEMLSTPSEEEYVSLISISIFVFVLWLCIVIGHWLEEHRWMNESITTLVIGFLTGGIILATSQGKNSRLLVFSEDVFFIYLLPPIIFNAGFQVKKKQFFRNFTTIALFGAVGTLISFFIISIGANILLRKLDIGELDIGDFLAIGAIFSATDSVCTLQVLKQDETPFLYSVVFGEGVVNDATSVVLFNAIQNFDLQNIDMVIVLQLVGNFLYLFAASTILGVAAGLISARLVKLVYFGQHSTDREVAHMILVAYLSYVLSDLLNLSGILTVFFCGIVMSHYTWYNVTEKSRVTTKHGFATLSFIAEMFIFLYVGMDALDLEKWRFVKDSPGTSVGVSSILLGLILIGRAAFVFPLSFVSNLSRRNAYEKITLNQQVTIWWAGLMRGAVSMALAYNQFTRFGYTRMRGHAIMITSTITVVLVSTVFFGLLTKPLIRHLLPAGLNRMDSATSDPSSPNGHLVPLIENGHGFDSEAPADRGVPRPTSLRMLLTTPSHIHYYWRRFDDSYMRPWFGGRGFVPFVPGSPTEQSVRPLTPF